MNPDEIRRDVQQVEARIRPQVESFNTRTAKLSEFIVDHPKFIARAPLSPAEIEMAISLNAVAEVIHNEARKAADRDDVKWEGLAEAVTLLRNEIAARGLPPVARFEFG